MTDSGGSNAIKGFNYQKAVIAYVAVHNFKTDDFYIIPEGRDDAEIFSQGVTTFIQVKSEKLSISKIAKRDKKTQKSIIGKLFDKNTTNALYKIVTTNKFSEIDKKNLILKLDHLFPCENYGCSPLQTQKICLNLLNEKFTPEQAEVKLKNTTITISPFDDTYDTAIKFLLGSMSEANINIDRKVGNIALTELFTQIDQKSELPYDKATENLDRKKIKKIDLDKIFITSNIEQHKNEYRKELLALCKFSLQDKSQIQIALYSINSAYKDLKNKIKKKIGAFNVDNGNEADQVKNLFKSLNVNNNEKYIIYAIIIDIIVDKITDN